MHVSSSSMLATCHVASCGQLLGRNSRMRQPIHDAGACRSPCRMTVHAASQQNSTAVRESSFKLFKSISALPKECSLISAPIFWTAQVHYNLAAVPASVIFNLLLVYAFLPPVRSTVATIVREKELRLREGMRIFGLRVCNFQGPCILAGWLLEWAVGG